MEVISLSSVNKTYNPGLFKKKVAAVRNLDLRVMEGEVFGLIGPNGAGKSSTIRLLLGLSRPNSGAILFRGTPIEQSRIRYETGYLPENPYLYDHLTLRELLRFSGKTSGLDSEAVARRSAELASMLGLEQVQDRPLRTYSKGMLQRAGICFALLSDPSVVILDEPMSGLDPVGRKMVFDLVMDLKRQGKTIFFCSHILSDVERLCDRIGILLGGSLVATLDREEFREDLERTVHLVIADLSEAQRAALEEASVVLTRSGAKQILSVSRTDHLRVLEMIQAQGIEVLGSRTERISLEDHFMQIVKEQS